MEAFLLVCVAVVVGLGFLGVWRREAEARRMLAALGERLERSERAQEQLAARLAAVESGVPGTAPVASGPATPAAPGPVIEAPLATEVPPLPLPTELVPPPIPPEAAAPEAAASGPALPPPGLATPPAPPAPRAPSPWAGLKLPKLDWEQVVGVKLFSWFAGAAIMVAAALFARYSIQVGWITPPIRMAIGLAAGLALLVGGESRRAQAYRVTAQSLAAGGVATLFATLLAAHRPWGLLGGGVTFALLALVAAVAVLISIRRDALVVALLGLLGGFATPLLLSTGENHPYALFSYLLLLDVGLAWVAYQKRWPILSAIALGLTALYQLGWVATFLDTAQLPIAIGAFLIFPLVGFAGLALSRRRAAAGSGPESALSRWTAAAGAVPPALLAFYLAASGAYAAEWKLVLAFAALVAVGLAAVSAWQGPEWLHLAGAGTVLVVLAGLLAGDLPAAEAAWPALGWTTALLAALFLALPLGLAALGRDHRAEGRLGTLAAPLSLFVFVVMGATRAGAAPAGVLLPVLLVAAGCAAFAVARADGRVHLAGAVLALLALASWSAFHLDAPTLLPALLAYAAAAALLVAAPLLAERRGRPLAGGAPGPLLLGALALLLFVAARPAAGAAVASLAGLTVLAALIQAALFREAARGRGAGFALAGVALGFFVLALWGVTALAGAVLPGLLAAAALGAVALAGALYVDAATAGPGGAARAGEPSREAPHLALAAHLFVAVVASTRSLAVPVWPWLAVLGVLDLGFIAAALLRRRADLLPGPAALTVLVLAGHVLGLGVEAPAPEVAGAAAVAAGALFLAGFWAARRTGAEPEATPALATLAAALALHGGQAVLLLAASADGLPVALLLPAHLALGAGVLALAWRAPLEVLAVSGAVAGALAAPLLAVAGAGHLEVLSLATPAWLLALAYPLLRFRRAPSERLPFLGAVLASFAYLLVARRALLGLGAGPYLGALPVLEALLLVPHLVLLRRGPRGAAPSPADQGRFALVAAAVLALATVAVPLQLDRQWITLGWALEGAALAWLWRRVPHRGLLAWSAGLLAAVFVRLVANPWVFAYAPRSATPVWNWYLYTYALSAAAFFLAARWLAGGHDRASGSAAVAAWPGWPRLAPLAAAGGGVLLFVLLNIEIADFWSTGPRIDFQLSAGLAPDLSYTVGWAVFALGTLLAGVLLESRATRLAAILLLSVTVVKAFGHDLLRLEGLYRVASLVMLALGLALMALVLQRFVLRRSERPQTPTHPEAS